MFEKAQTPVDSFILKGAEYLITTRDYPPEAISPKFRNISIAKHVKMLLTLSYFHGGWGEEASRF